MDSSALYFNKKFSPLEIKLAVDGLGFAGLVEMKDILTPNTLINVGRLTDFYRYPATSIDGTCKAETLAVCLQVQKNHECRQKQ